MNQLMKIVATNPGLRLKVLHGPKGGLRLELKRQGYPIGNYFEFTMAEPDPDELAFGVTQLILSWQTEAQWNSPELKA